MGFTEGLSSGKTGGFSSRAQLYGVINTDNVDTGNKAKTEI
jgi:hypothetical protein